MRNENGSEVILKLSWNVTSYFNDETNFSNKLLFINTQVLILCKSFAKT